MYCLDAKYLLFFVMLSVTRRFFISNTLFDTQMGIMPTSSNKGVIDVHVTQMGNNNGLENKTPLLSTSSRGRV